MDRAAKIQGSIICRERKRKGIEQKTLCRGICVPSYLSKIEHGTVKADISIMRALFARLGLAFFSEETELAKAQEILTRCYEKINYYLPLSEELSLLEGMRDKLVNSVCAPDYYIVLSLNGENCLMHLLQMSACLTPLQRAYMTLIQWKYGKKADLPSLKMASDIIGSSHALNVYATACYKSSQFAELLHLENRLTALALGEGNVFCLAEYNMLKGSAYSCLFLEDMMMLYFRRAIHLLQNTGWKNELATVYYNIGATMLQLKKYDEADAYLQLAKDMPDPFLLLHKRALLLIRKGDIKKGKRLIEKMQSLLPKDTQEGDARRLRLQELILASEEGFLENPAYLQTLEELIATLSKTEHIGHIIFYQDVFLAACKKQRQYKKALDFQCMISSRSKISVF